MALTTTSSGLSAGSITANASGAANDGSISLVAGANALSVVNGSSLSSKKGTILLQNSAAGTGTISIGSGVSLTTSTNGALGGVNVVIGAVPGSPVVGTRPSAVQAATSTGSNIYYGTNSIAANAPTNTVTASGANVIFNTGSRPASAITLGGADRINAGNALVASLDLNDAGTVTYLTGLQSEGTLGGTLTVTGGVATGGNIVVAPANLGTSIAALNVPANVTATMQGFTTGNSVSVNIDSGSTSTQALVSGTYQYLNSGASIGALTVTSSQAGAGIAD